MSRAPRHPSRLLWFVLLNLVALTAAGLLFLGFWFGHPLDHLMGRTAQAVIDRDALMVMIAASPIFAAVLVGIGYRKMAARRRETASKARSASPAEPEHAP